MCWSLISEHVVNHIFDSKTDLDLGTKVLLEQLLPEQDANVLAGLLEQALYCDNCIQAIKTIQQKSEAMKSLSGEIKSLSNQIGMRIAKNNSEPTQDIIKNQISDVNLKKLLSIRSKIIASMSFNYLFCIYISQVWFRYFRFVLFTFLISIMIVFRIPIP